jgi:hypothetical protein
MTAMAAMIGYIDDFWLPEMRNVCAVSRLIHRRYPKIGDRNRTARFNTGSFHSDRDPRTTSKPPDGVRNDAGRNRSAGDRSKRDQHPHELDPSGRDGGRVRDLLGDLDQRLAGGAVFRKCIRSSRALPANERWHVEGTARTNIVGAGEIGSRCRQGNSKPSHRPPADNRRSVGGRKIGRRPARAGSLKQKILAEMQPASSIWALTEDALVISGLGHGTLT